MFVFMFKFVIVYYMFLSIIFIKRSNDLQTMH